MAITTFLMYEPIRRLNNHLPQSIKIIGCLWANLIMDTLGDEWLSLSLHLYLALSLSPSPFLSISSLPLSPSLHFLHHPSPSSSTRLSFLASLLVSLSHTTQAIILSPVKWKLGKWNCFHYGCYLRPSRTSGCNFTNQWKLPVGHAKKALSRSPRFTSFFIPAWGMQGITLLPILYSVRDSALRLKRWQLLGRYYLASIGRRASQLKAVNNVTITICSITCCFMIQEPNKVNACCVD